MTRAEIKHEDHPTPVVHEIHEPPAPAVTATVHPVPTVTPVAAISPVAALVATAPAVTATPPAVPAAHVPASVAKPTRVATPILPAEPAAQKTKPISWASAAAGAAHTIPPTHPAPAAAPKAAAPKAAAPHTAAAAPVPAPAAAAPHADGEAKHEKTEKVEKRSSDHHHDHDNSVFLNGVTHEMEGEIRAAYSLFGLVRGVNLLKNGVRSGSHKFPPFFFFFSLLSQFLLYFIVLCFH